MLTRALALYALLVTTSCGGGSGDGSTSPSPPKADGVHCYEFEAHSASESRCFVNSSECKSAAADHRTRGDVSRLGDCKRATQPATCFDVFDDDADATQRRCFAEEAQCTNFVQERGFDPAPPCSAERKPISVSERGGRSGQFIAATPPDQPANCGRVAGRLESLEHREAIAAGDNLKGLGLRLNDVREGVLAACVGENWGEELRVCFIDAKSTDAANECEPPAESDPSIAMAGTGDKTGVASCDRFLARIAACTGLPQEMKQVIPVMAKAWKQAVQSGGTVAVRDIEKACQQVESSLKPSLTKAGC